MLANGVGHYAMFRVSDGARFESCSLWWDEIDTLLSGCRPSPQLLSEAAQLAEMKISTRVLL